MTSPRAKATTPLLAPGFTNPFVEKVKTHLASSYSRLSELAPVILTHLTNALSERRAFFAWSASDVRNMFDLLWDQLALTAPIVIESKGDMPIMKNVMFEI